MDERLKEIEKRWLAGSYINSKDPWQIHDAFESLFDIIKRLTEENERLNGFIDDGYVICPNCGRVKLD